MISEADAAQLCRQAGQGQTVPPANSRLLALNAQEGAQEGKAGQSARPGKFGNRISRHNGLRFDSDHEYRDWQELELRQAAGEISELQHHVRFRIEANACLVCLYECDAAYTIVATGEKVTQDSKGFKTPEYKIKKRLMAAIHGIVIKET